MTTTQHIAIDGHEYKHYPGQERLTCGDVIDFLLQFKRDQEIGWYLIAEDATPYVGLYSDENPNWQEDGGDPAWPMIVTSFVPHDEVR